MISKQPYPHFIHQPRHRRNRIRRKYYQSAEKAQETYSQFEVLQADDIANAVAYVLSQLEYVEVNDVLVRPTQQNS